MVKGCSLAVMLGLVVADRALAAQFMVEVKVEVQRGCLLIHQTREAGVQALGVLDFGRAARLDAPSGPMTAQLLSQRPPRLECNPDRSRSTPVNTAAWAKYAT